MEQNVFDTIQDYGGKWQEVARRRFNQGERAAVLNAMVTTGSFVDKQTGETITKESVIFTMKSGKTKYIGLSRNSNLKVGDPVNLAEVELVTLERDGETTLRVE